MTTDTNDIESTLAVMTLMGALSVNASNLTRTLKTRQTPRQTNVDADGTAGIGPDPWKPRLDLTQNRQAFA